MPRPVSFLDLCQLEGKIRGGEIAVLRHVSHLAGMGRREGKIGVVKGKDPFVLEVHRHIRKAFLGLSQ